MAKETRPLDDSDTTEQERVLEPFTVSSRLTSAVFVMDRTNFTDVNKVLTVRAEYKPFRSVDWRFWCGFTTKGGQTTDPTLCSTSLLPPSGSQVRIALQASGGTIRQALHLEEES